MDALTREYIKEQRNILQRKTLGLTAKKRSFLKHKKPCIRGCGNLAWHPPFSTGRCQTCANKEIRNVK